MAIQGTDTVAATNYAVHIYVYWAVNGIHC